MKYQKQWISKPLYEALPFVFFLAAIAFLQIAKHNIFLTLFAIFLFCYAAYIFAWRLMYRDSILINHELAE